MTIFVLKIIYFFIPPMMVWMCEIFARQKVSKNIIPFGLSIQSNTPKVGKIISLSTQAKISSQIITSNF